VATIGGNVVGGGPASELAIALIALGARARVVGPDGEREADVETLEVRPGELVRSFELPDSPLRWGWQRLPLHGAMDRSSASVAVTFHRNGARVVVGCVADRVVRMPRTEAALAEGRKADIAAAAAADLDGVDLKTDDRASADHRRKVIPVLVERAAR
jgi:CO/xanthine dehydrogenase FAD-binding subunit